MNNYAKHTSTRKTPQNEAVLGRDQVENNAGGFVFKVTPENRLDRFLILGSEGNKYYTTEKELTVANAENIHKLLSSSHTGLKVVERVVEISTAGRAPKNSPAIFVLAMAAAAEQNGQPLVDVRQAALKALPLVARTATDLFQFLGYVRNFRGWGRGLVNAVSRWYTEREVESLAYQGVKYRNREGYTHRDALRLAKPVPKSAEQNALFGFLAEREVATDKLPNIVQGFVALQLATTAAEAAKLVTTYKLPRECVPTQFLGDKIVWEALLPTMPLNAMIRNLGNMSKAGLLLPLSDSEKLVVDKLGNLDALKKSRLHPLKILTALKIYERGKGIKGKGEWTTTPGVLVALEKAFYDSFQNVVASGKRFLVGVDVSGSMSTTLTSDGALSACEAAAALSMVLVKTEPRTYVHGFAKEFVDLKFSASTNLLQAVKKGHMVNFGSTDCALPIVYAMSKGIEVDVFVVITDNETWVGGIHPFQALKQYRAKTGINAKLVVIGIDASQFTIADPSDAGMLDVTGFDAAIPQLVQDFAAGKL